MRASRSSSALVVLLALVAAPLGGVASCSVGELDLTGKQCPCASGYVCDVPSNTCSRGVADGGAELDAPSDALASPDRDPDALIVVRDLKVAWTAPATVRWEWTVAGKAADFQAYEVATATTADDLAKRAGSFEVVSGNDRPEVRTFDARGGTKEGTFVVWTTTSVRGANTRQVMQVKATDVRGRSTSTAVVAVVSSAVADSTKLIFDGSVAKTAKPADFQYRTPVGGPNAYVLVVDCGAGAGASPCAKRAELTDLGIDLASGGAFNAADFAAAFVQVELEGNVSVASFDSVLSVDVGNGCPDCRYGYPGFTQSGVAKTTLQVPLRELRNAKGEALTQQLLATKNFQIFGLSFSGTWKQGALLRLLDARIRW